MASGSLLRTPLHDRHVARGARMADFAGFEMPISYEGILAEHRRVREAAGLFDVGGFSTAVVTTQLIGIGVATLWNFFVNFYWTWKKETG